MKKSSTLGLVFLTVVAITVLATYDRVEGDESTSAEAVIQEYYNGLSNKDLAVLQALQVNLGNNFLEEQILDGLNNVELLSIEENNKAIDWYVRQEQANDYAPENILAFEVKADFDYQSYTTLYYMSGIQKQTYFLVRESENSPWLIAYIN